MEGGCENDFVTRAVTARVVFRFFLSFADLTRSYLTIKTRLALCARRYSSQRGQTPHAATPGDSK